MTFVPEWHARFEGWSRQLAGQPVPRLPRELVHKQRPENVMVARVERVSADAPGRFAVQLCFDPDHPFFFEHECGHVPGLALIEAGRQAGLAVAHRFYGVPADGSAKFMVRDLAVRFERFARTDAPVFGDSVVTSVRRRRGRLSRMTYEGHFLQDGRTLGAITGTWWVVEPALLARLEQREAS